MEIDQAKDTARSAGTDDACVQRARRQVAVEKRWGKWYVVFQLLAGIAFLGVGVFFIVFVSQCVSELNPGNMSPRFHDGVRDGLSLGLSVGLVSGFLAGFLLLLGAYLFAQGVRAVRGDRTSRTLVAYHDALFDRAREQTPASTILTIDGLEGSVLPVPLLDSNGDEPATEHAIPKGDQQLES